MKTMTTLAVAVPIVSLLLVACSSADPAPLQQGEQVGEAEAALCDSNCCNTCCQYCPNAGGGVNDRGNFSGTHYVELYASFSSSNASTGMLISNSCGANRVQCGNSANFDTNVVICDGVWISSWETYTSSSQINIAFSEPACGQHSCTTFSSSNNSQFISFEWTFQDC